ncbi:hypothetical protein JHN61_26105 [Streptomyces sp. MBT67]|uniref:hypothetical protein n=1 Tax=unclassified Streptomyces TaxID=2593676 RepID=UPI0019095122|nr:MULTISPECIES: hypothetical protein [unclassified Streptomyces]MBK3534543.1 hypothetical protein [Streptomyces sp. MBT72]MBK3539630.1 hypothetical protein [Streptomyces sp. MBT67]MBK6047827.1 hypothetical protein [Streptomyces sp. MBT55]
MKHETPRTPDGTKLCAWCGDVIRQSGVGRSRDYCRRLCRDRAYKKRRDQRLIDEAVAAVRHVSPSVETGPAAEPVSPDGETEVSEEDYLLAPPVVAEPVLPVAWRAPAARRPLSRRRAESAAESLPLWGE